MKKWIKRIALVLGILIVLLITYVLYQISLVGPAANGYTAKMIGSGVFIVGQTPKAAFLDFPENPIKGLLKIKVNPEEKWVTSSIIGLAKRKAIYREGYGVTLIPKGNQITPLPSLRRRAELYSPEALWPLGERVDFNSIPAEIDRHALQQALNNVFSESCPELPRRTRAVVVVYKGQIIAERYAPGFTEDTPLLGWSMTKSIVNALVGILVGQGKLQLYAPAPVPEWSNVNDPRHAITLDQLLRMSSGLEFVEDYGDLTSDILKLLYVTADAGAFAAQKSLIHLPDSVWHYSSGTSVILTRLIRHTCGSFDDYVNFPYQELFGPLGMHSAVFETDPSGTFFGSSFLYATARDWARFGLLYLQDGVWNSYRILPEGWVEYTTSPTPQSPLGEYGAHFCLNAGNPKNSIQRFWPDLPTGIFYADGHDGQHTVIIPSRELVVVRLGLSQKAGSWSLGDFLRDILKAVPEVKTTEIQTL